MKERIPAQKKRNTEKELIPKPPRQFLLQQEAKQQGSISRVFGSGSVSKRTGARRRSVLRARGARVSTERECVLCKALTLEGILLLKLFTSRELI